MPALFRNVALENLDHSEHLDHFMKITTPSRWLLALGFIIIFAAIATWSFFGNIKTSEDGTGWIQDSKNRDAVASARIFLPAPSHKNIQKGLPVWLEPTNYPAEYYGYLIGEITALHPMTAAQWIDQPELASLKNHYSEEHDLLEVQVLLAQTEAGAFGVWTLKHTAGILPLAGTPIKAKIILAEQRPVDLLFRTRFEADE